MPQDHLSTKLSQETMESLEIKVKTSGSLREEVTFPSQADQCSERPNFAKYYYPLPPKVFRKREPLLAPPKKPYNPNSKWQSFKRKVNIFMYDVELCFVKLGRTKKLNKCIALENNAFRQIYEIQKEEKLRELGLTFGDYYYEDISYKHPVEHMREYPFELFEIVFPPVEGRYPKIFPTRWWDSSLVLYTPIDEKKEATAMTSESSSQKTSLDSATLQGAAITAPTQVSSSPISKTAVSTTPSNDDVLAFKTTAATVFEKNITSELQSSAEVAHVGPLYQSTSNLDGPIATDSIQDEEDIVLEGRQSTSYAVTILPFINNSEYTIADVEIGKKCTMCRYFSCKCEREKEEAELMASDANSNLMASEDYTLGPDAYSVLSPVDSACRPNYDPLRLLSLDRPTTPTFFGTTIFPNQLSTEANDVAKIDVSEDSTLRSEGSDVPASLEAIRQLFFVQPTDEGAAAHATEVHNDESSSVYSDYSFHNDDMELENTAASQIQVKDSPMIKTIPTATQKSVDNGCKNVAAQSALSEFLAVQAKLNPPVRGLAANLEAKKAGELPPINVLEELNRWKQGEYCTLAFKRYETDTYKEGEPKRPIGITTKLSDRYGYDVSPRKKDVYRPPKRHERTKMDDWEALRRKQEREMEKYNNELYSPNNLHRPPVLNNPPVRKTFLESVIPTSSEALISFFEKLSGKSESPVSTTTPIFSKAPSPADHISPAGKEEKSTKESKQRSPSVESTPALSPNDQEIQNIAKELGITLKVFNVKKSEPPKTWMSKFGW